MSRWTHIAGIVRYDDLVSNRAEAYKEMHWIEQQHFQNAPHGSEGPMDYTVLPTHSYEQEHNITTHGPGLCDVAFSGDFRDFSKDDWPQLRAWFKQITTDSGLEVRQAVLLIEDDDYPRAKQEVLTYKATQ